MKILPVKVIPEMDNIPDGDYSGVMGGYVVDVTINGVKCEIHTNYGIRTFNYPCVVIVRGGKVLEIGAGVYTPPPQSTAVQESQ